MSTEDTSRKSLGGTLRPTTSDYLFCGHERAGLLRFQHSLGASVCPRCKERKPFYWNVFSGRRESNKGTWKPWAAWTPRCVPRGKPPASQRRHQRGSQRFGACGVLAQ